MRTTLLALALALAACGGDNNETPDAAPPDAPVDAGRPTLQNTPQVYCDTIQAACVGTGNVQYPNANQCLATAEEFPPGANANEMTGNTLGCRIYHAQNAMITGDLATHCPHAGPGGNKIDLTVGQCGAPCDNFCDLNVAVCGTDAAPVAGVTNRYATRDACIAACNGFAKAPLFSAPAPAGNTFACRLFHLTNAALYKNQATPDPTNHNFHCGHTLNPAVGMPAVCI